LLGDGGTVQMAHVVVDWMVERFMPALVERVVSDLVGVREASEAIGESRASVLRWSEGNGRTDFPAPVLTLSCGKHWSRTTLTNWSQDHLVRNGA
jgi:hypothetical protein